MGKRGRQPKEEGTRLVQISVKGPPELKEEIERIAKDAERSVSQQMVFWAKEAIRAAEFLKQQTGNQGRDLEVPGMAGPPQRRRA